MDPESKTLNYQDFYNRCILTGPDAVVVQLKQSGILPSRVTHYLDNPNHDEDEKTEKLVNVIEAQVKNDPTLLSTFTDALEAAESHNRTESETLDYQDFYNRCLLTGPDAVVVQLKRSDILPSKVTHYLDNPNHDEDEKTKKLVNAIVARVKKDPTLLSTFTDALEAAESHKKTESGPTDHGSSLKYWILTSITVLVAALLIYWYTQINTENKVLVDTPPNFEILSAFPVQTRKENSTINIIERIAVHYFQFGKHILDDHFGNQVEAIQETLGPDKVVISQEILSEWLNGRGKKPVTWGTLIMALNCTESVLDLVEDILPSIPSRLMNIPSKIPYNRTITFSDKLKTKYKSQPIIDPYQKLLSTVKKDMDIMPILSPVVKLKGDKHVNITIREILPGSRILFTGRPGVGKSTLTRYMALNWAEGELLTHCVLTIRSELFLTVSSLNQLLSKAYKDFTKTPQVETEIKDVEGKGVCFILDAFDEYIQADRGRDDFIDDLLKRESLQHATVIMTSRNCTKIDELINTKTFSTHYEVIEFSKSDIDRYVNQLPSKLKANISKVFDLNFHVKEMCRLPLHLTMVLNLALVDKDRLSVIDTETMLYEDFLILSIKQYQFRSGWSPGSMEQCLEDENASTELCTTFKIMCKFAYTTLFQPFDLSYFDNDETSFLQTHADIFMNISLFGVEIEHGRHQEHSHYSFAHRTFQEYLAAFYMSRISLQKVLSTVDTYLEHDNSTLIWKFYFGIIGKYKYKDGIDDQALLSTLKSFLPKFSTRKCSIEYDSRNKFLLDFAYEARMTRTLQQLMDETSLITGPECDNYSLEYPMMITEGCIRFPYILTWIKIRSLTIKLYPYLNYDNCEAVFLHQRSNKMFAQLFQIKNLTIIDMFGRKTEETADTNVVLTIFSLITTPNLSTFNYICGPDYQASEKYGTDYSIRKTTQGYGHFKVNILEKLLVWLRDGTHLESLQIQCVLDETAVETLSDSLQYWENLHYLTSIFRSTHSDKTMDKFSSNLLNVSRLESLSITWTFEGFTTSEYAVSMMSKSIAQLKYLRSLSIDCNSYHSQKNHPCTGIVAASLASLSSLEYLRLSGHSFGSSESHMFASALSKSTVTHLVLEESFFDTREDYRTIMTSLQEMQQLRALVFHGQCKSLIHTCHLLQNEKSLSSEMGLDSTFSYLCDLNNNYMRSSFTLDSNLLSEMKDIMVELRRLEHLEISYTCVSYNDAQVLSLILPHLSNLYSFHFSLNHISDDSYKVVLKSIKEMEQLKRLSLYKNFEILRSHVHINYPLDLSKLTNLTYLDVSTYHILDESAIRSLSLLPSLLTVVPHIIFCDRPETKSHENKVNSMWQTIVEQNITIDWCNKFHC